MSLSDPRSQDRDDDQDDARTPSTVREDIAREVAMAALPRAVRRRLDRGDPVAIVAVVPGPDWAGPIGGGFEVCWVSVTAMARDGSSRADHQAERGNEVVSSVLSQGRAIVGVSQDPQRLLPSSLIACADAHVAVARPHAPVLRRLLRRHARGPVPRCIPDDACAALSFNDIVASFRYRASAREVLGNLARARSAKTKASLSDDTPPLARLPGYSGGARRWAENLVAAYRSWRAGAPWSPVAAILSGPPGTGKTTLAKAVARTLDIPIVTTSVGQWLSAGEGHLGDACRMATQAFDASRTPCLILVDELDALPDRARLSDRAAEWWTTLVTHVCLLADSVRSVPGICLISCTNHEARIDAAIRRRFSRVVEVGLPTPADLQAIILHHAGHALPEADLGALCRMAPRASAADAARWVADARNSARAAGRDLTLADIANVVMPSDTRPPHLLLHIGRHEAAHAVVGHALGVQQLGSVSLVGHDAAGVANFDLPVGPLTRDVLEALVVTALAGRAADCLWGGGPDAGSAGGPGSDAFLATRLLAAARMSWALGDGAPICVGTAEDAHSMLRADPGLRAAVEADLRRLDGRARSLVAEYGPAIGLVAQALAAERWLSGDRVRAIVRRARRVDARRMAKTTSP